MNRAQRRSANRDDPKRPSAAAGWFVMQARLYRSSTKPMQPDDINELVLPVYTAIMKLSSGMLDADEYIRLNEMNAFGFCLAAYIHKHGDDATKAVIAPSQAVFETAGEQIASIGERRNRTGKFGATGDELLAIRNMTQWLDQLCQVSTRGAVLTSLMQAEQMVKEAIAGRKAA